MTTEFPHKDFNKQSFPTRYVQKTVSFINMVLIFLLPQTFIYNGLEKNVHRILECRFRLSMEHLYKQVDGPIKRHVTLGCENEIDIT